MIDEKNGQHSTTSRPFTAASLGYESSTLCDHCGETDCGPGECWAAPQPTKEQLADAREAEDERRARQAASYSSGR